MSVTTDGGDIDLAVIIPDTPTLGDAAGATGTSLITDGVGPSLAIRTLKSSDASVTVVPSGTGDIDLTAVIPPAVTLSATQTGFVDVGTAPNYSLTIGPVSGSTKSFALTNKTTAYNFSELSTFFGVDAAPNHSANIYGGTFIGANAGKLLTTGNYNTLIGVDAGTNITTSAQNTIVGGLAAKSLSTAPGGINTIVGWQTASNRITPSQHNSFFGAGAGSVDIQSAVSGQCAFGFYAGNQANGDNSIFIGKYAGSNNGITNSGAIIIGYQACLVASPGAQVGQNSIHMGTSCAPDSTAGRLNFGSSMEAPHGSFAMPNAGVPQAYIKVKWNGTLYYIPAYTTVPT